MKTQDVSKKGLIYGDEEEDQAEKKELEAQKIAFAPLINWLKKELKGDISDGELVHTFPLSSMNLADNTVILTNRLVTSPCTIIVDSFGWSANMAKIMSAQADAENDPMFEMMKKLPKNLEINPKSPLIEGLLERVLDLELGGAKQDGDDEEDQAEADSPEIIELRETVKVLVDTTMVRSGFSVADPTT